MSARRTLKRPGARLGDRRALLDANTASPDEVAKAVAIVDSALLSLSLGSSTMTSILYVRCHYHVPTTAIPTMAVTVTADGTAMLLYNPHFVISLDRAGTEFVLAHEARHIIMRHLFAEPHLRADPVFTTATEACINHVVMNRLGKSEMPTARTEVVDTKTGTVKIESLPTGIDPRVVHKKYSEDLTAQGLQPVTYRDFIITDFACYHELKRMTNPPSESDASRGGIGACIHQDESEGSADGTSQDAEASGELARDVLHATMKAAMAGKKGPREELLELGERTDGSGERVSKIWGDLGLARLRGETSSARRTDFWKQWTNDTLASKLQAGERVIYVKKRAGVDAMLELDPILMRRGEEELKVVLICLDTSGSMPDHVINYLTKLVGQTDGIEAHWLSFDGQVVPFVAGERVVGGGGTNFKNVMDYAEGRLSVNGHKIDAHPDAVIMLTDGMAEPIRPAEPEKWMWLITERGDDGWIRSQPNPMDSHKLETGYGL